MHIPTTWWTCTHMVLAVATTRHRYEGCAGRPAWLMTALELACATLHFRDASLRGETVIKLQAAHKARDVRCTAVQLDVTMQLGIASAAQIHRTAPAPAGAVQARLSRGRSAHTQHRPPGRLQRPRVRCTAFGATRPMHLIRAAAAACARLMWSGVNGHP